MYSYLENNICVIKKGVTFDPLFHRPVLAIVHGRIEYCPLSAMSGRRPLAVRNVAHPRYKYNNNSQYRKYPDHLFCQKLCLLPTALSFTALFDSGLYSILQALFLEAYRERCAFKLGDEIKMQMWIGKKKTDFF